MLRMLLSSSPGFFWALSALYAHFKYGQKPEQTGANSGGFGGFYESLALHACLYGCCSPRTLLMRYSRPICTSDFAICFSMVPVLNSLARRSTLSMTSWIFCI